MCFHAAVFHQLLEDGNQPAARGSDEGGGQRHHLIGAAFAVEFDAVELGAAQREQVFIPEGEDGFAAQILHALPAAQHGADHVQPLFQHCHGAGVGNEEAGGDGDQQTGGEDLHAKARAVEHSREHGDTDADQQAQQRVHTLHLFRGGGTAVGVHEVLDFRFAPHQTGLSFIIVGNFGDALEADGLAQGIHLPHFGGAALAAGGHGHGHFQTEGGAAGNPQLHKAGRGVHAAGDERKGKQRIQVEPALEDAAKPVQHQMAAQQAGYQHGQHLTEDHQTHPVFRHHIQRQQRGDTGAQQHDDEVQQNADLQFADAQLRQLIVPLFGACHQLLFQLPQTLVGVKGDGRGLGLLRGFRCGGVGTAARQRFGDQIVDGSGVVAGSGFLRFFGKCFGVKADGVAAGNRVGGFLGGFGSLGGFGLLRCRGTNFLHQQHVYVQFLLRRGILDVIVGIFVKFPQDVVKIKFLRFVGIVHMGFLLVKFGCCQPMRWRTAS